MSARPAPAPDEALARRAREEPESPAGRAAAAELLERYAERVYRWCRLYVKDHDRAQDLAQEVLLKAYRSLAAFEGRSQFSSWLFAVARNRCLSAVRAPSWVHDDEAAIEDRSDPSPPPGAGLEELEEETELLELVRATLDPQEQQAVWLRCYERLPVEEITQVLGLTSATGARGLLQRARRKLSAALELRRRERNPGS